MSKKTKGFSLLECSISLSLGFMLIMSGLYAYQLLKREVIFSHKQIEHFISSLEIQQFLKNDLRSNRLPQSMQQARVSLRLDAQFKPVAYYLGTPARFVGAHSKVFSLYRDDFSKNAEEIIAGVVELAFEYQMKDHTGYSPFDSARPLLDAQWLEVFKLRLNVKFEGGQKAIYEFSVPNRVHIGGGLAARHIDQSFIYPSD